jgi:hypothetical protein
VSQTKGIDMKKLLAKMFIKKDRKEQIEKFARLVHEVKRVASPYECQCAIRSISDFNKELKDGDQLKPALGKMLEFVLDTREHSKKGFHKPAHNGWQNKKEFPNINDYLKLGVEIKDF